ncbi:Topless-related protein 2 [Raphanus sativus]|nr:Topless-related protein 2 [Raphanus sativus]
MCVVTCGDDKLIKVWDLSGKKLYTFEGHDAQVYSICPHQKENIQDSGGTTMLYSADGSRLFSCGTSKDGDSFLVEWNESEGALKRTYLGFRKKSNGVVQFDTTRNRYLAVW